MFILYNPYSNSEFRNFVFYYRQDRKAQVPQVSDTARIWLHVHLAPTPVLLLLHWGLPVCSLGFFHTQFQSHGVLLCTSCTRADSFNTACHHLWEPSLPWSLLKFIVLVLLFSQFVKIRSHFLRFYFKSFETHTSISLSPNETKFIHNPKSQSVIMAIVLKSQRPVDPSLDLLLLLHILR